MQPVSSAALGSLLGGLYSNARAKKDQKIKAIGRGIGVGASTGLAGALGEAIAAGSMPSALGDTGRGLGSLLGATAGGIGGFYGSGKLLDHLGLTKEELYSPEPLLDKLKIK